MLADIFFSYRVGDFFLSIFICYNVIYGNSRVF